MADVANMILRDIYDDPTIKVRGLAVEEAKHGLFSRRRSLVIRGTVTTRQDREKIERIATHHAGDLYDIDNQVEVREPAET